VTAPVLPDWVVPRARIDRRISEGACGPVTVITGPPGAGKTTALASWAAARTGALPTAWVTVDLILDDLHLLSEPDALGGLEYVLRNARSGLRLVAAARTEPQLPLHRYRLAGEMTEIRAADLAFTAAEVTTCSMRSRRPRSPFWAHSSVRSSPSGLRP
jgi:LuxR family maltose regulon positive regulatory protein